MQYKKNRDNVPLIKFENVRVKFGNKFIFKKLNFKIGKNEKFIFFGPSGIGKTTILKLIMGFEQPYEGKIYFLGEPLNKRNIWILRKNISYVPQNTDIGEGKTHNLIEEIFSLKTNAHINLNKEELKDLLNFMELEKDILEKDYEKLSGGEKQRICIIIAILLKRDILLLDEITSSLDYKLKNKVISYFMKQKDKTALIISHDKIWLRYKNIKKYDMGKNYENS